MLRTYTPIKHKIFDLHQRLTHLVCEVWCNASNAHTCEQLIEVEFEAKYKKIKDLKPQIDEVYEQCKTLTLHERQDIRSAFILNNCIQDLCNGTFKPVDLISLNPVVETLMKPVLMRFYNDLITSSSKLSYYNALIRKNKFTTCPCCSLSPIETAESHYVEDNDHYLPKADYPFAVVNFRNLVPLCSKCNKKCKTTHSPFEDGRISFYPFDGSRPNINITVKIVSGSIDYTAVKENEIVITFDNDGERVATWNWLFKIETRYNEQIRSISRTELRLLRKRFRRNQIRKDGLTYEDIMNDLIDEYNDEQYEDRKFLKIAFLEEMKNKPEWMAVYSAV